MASGDGTDPEDTSRLAELKRATFARPDETRDPSASRDALDLLERQLRQDRHDVREAVAAAVLPPDRTELAVRRPSHALTNLDPSEDIDSHAGPSVEAPLRTPRRRRLAIVSSALVALLIVATVGASWLALTTPREPAAFDTPLASADELPDSLRNVPEVHRIGAALGWNVYLARNTNAQVCMFVAVTELTVGSSCVSEEEFEKDGIEVRALLAPPDWILEEGHLEIVRFRSNRDGQVDVVLPDPPSGLASAAGA